VSESKAAGQRAGRNAKIVWKSFFYSDKVVKISLESNRFMAELAKLGKRELSSSSVPGLLFSCF
jgi:hypothetical protein